MKKFLSVKYIPYFFYMLSVLGIVFGILYPDKILTLWVVIFPYIIGSYLQVNGNKAQPPKYKIVKILIFVIIGLLLMSAIAIMTLFLI